MPLPCPKNVHTIFIKKCLQKPLEVEAELNKMWKAATLAVGDKKMCQLHAWSVFGQAAIRACLFLLLLSMPEVCIDKITSLSLVQALWKEDMDAASGQLVQLLPKPVDAKVT